MVAGTLASSACRRAQCVGAGWGGGATRGKPRAEFSRWSCPARNRGHDAGTPAPHRPGWPAGPVRALGGSTCKGPRQQRLQGPAATGRGCRQVGLGAHPPPRGTAWHWGQKLGNRRGNTHAGEVRGFQVLVDAHHFGVPARVQKKQRRLQQRRRSTGCRSHGPGSTHGGKGRPHTPTRGPSARGHAPHAPTRGTHHTRHARTVGARHAGSIRTGPLCCASALPSSSKSVGCGFATPAPESPATHMPPQQQTQQQTRGGHIRVSLARRGCCFVVFNVNHRRCPFARCPLPVAASLPRPAMRTHRF